MEAGYGLHPAPGELVDNLLLLLKQMTPGALFILCIIQGSNNMIDIIDHGEVRELRLNRPPVNALNPALIRTLTEMIKEGGRASGALVLSGRPGMFSAGLDVPALLALDREEGEHFVRSFFKLMETVARSPVPIASAITGHSPAGGTVIVIFGDYRVMCKGPYRMGLNEVQVGLTVPASIQHAMTRLTGKHRGERLMVAGRLLLPEEAYDAGLVDTLVDVPEDAVQDAITWCKNLLALPRHAMLATRKIARSDIAGIFDQLGEQDIARFVESWFDLRTQTALGKLVEKLGK